MTEEHRRGRPTNEERARRLNALQASQAEPEPVKLTEPIAEPIVQTEDSYKPMSSAPKDRAVTLAPHGMRAQWRERRKFAKGNWRRYECWTDWLTGRPLHFEPTGWKD
ncbi:MAG: hypothetical protein KGL39_29445 [Patescibacteria group bacterium]|nr:hypothetical protein [Patescibacteria group bacterium]